MTDSRRLMQLLQATGLPPRELDAAGMEFVRKTVWPDTPYPQKLPWRVPPQWVEQWAMKWVKYHQETKHERQRAARTPTDPDTAEAEARTASPLGRARAEAWRTQGEQADGPCGSQ